MLKGKGRSSVRLGLIVAILWFQVPHVSVRGFDAVLTHLLQYLTKIGLEGGVGGGRRRTHDEGD